MLDYKEIQTIRRLNSKNKNIMEYLRKKNKLSKNSLEIIQYSYDLQAGSYYSKRPILLNSRKKIARKLSEVISNIAAKNILEAGVGEGNTLAQVVTKKMKIKPSIFGFDISLSRLLYAQKYLNKYDKKNVNLFTSELGNIPLENDSIDMVFTVHSLEPNHGREKELLEELFRITRRYVVLIEPSYELGSKKTRKHIEKYGYVRNLPTLIKKMKHKIISYEYLGFSSSKNENALIIAKKIPSKKQISKKVRFVSPISYKPLKKRKDCLYCEQDGYAFPIINGIPCLLKTDGILVSKLNYFS